MQHLSTTIPSFKHCLLIMSAVLVITFILVFTDPLYPECQAYVSILPACKEEGVGFVLSGSVLHSHELKAEELKLTQNQKQGIIERLDRYTVREICALPSLSTTTNAKDSGTELVCIGIVLWGVISKLYGLNERIKLQKLHSTRTISLFYFLVSSLPPVGKFPLKAVHCLSVLFPLSVIATSFFYTGV